MYLCSVSPCITTLYYAMYSIDIHTVLAKINRTSRLKSTGQVICNACGTSWFTSENRIHRPADPQAVWKVPWGAESSMRWKSLDAAACWVREFWKLKGIMRDYTFCMNERLKSIWSHCSKQRRFPQQETHEARALGGAWYCLMMFVCHYLPRRDCAEAPVPHCPCSFTSTLPAPHQGSTLAQHCSCESLVGAKSMTRRMKDVNRWSSMKHETTVLKIFEQWLFYHPYFGTKKSFLSSTLFVSSKALKHCGVSRALGRMGSCKGAVDEPSIHYTVCGF